MLLAFDSVHSKSLLQRYVPRLEAQYVQAHQLSKRTPLHPPLRFGHPGTLSSSLLFSGTPSKRSPNSNSNNERIITGTMEAPTRNDGDAAYVVATQGDNPGNDLAAVHPGNDYDYDFSRVVAVVAMDGTTRRRRRSCRERDTTTSTTPQTSATAAPESEEPPPPSTLRRRSRPGFAAVLWCCAAAAFCTAAVADAAGEKHADCWRAVRAANLDGNPYLSAEEFASLLDRWTNGYVDFDRDKAALPPGIILSYTTRADRTNGQLPIVTVDAAEATPEQLEVMSGFCSEMELSLYQHFYGQNAVIGIEECKSIAGDVVFADENFPAVAQQLSALADPQASAALPSSYAELPPSLRYVFESYDGQDSGLILLAGLDDEYYLGFCYETALSAAAASNAVPDDGAGDGDGGVVGGEDPGAGNGGSADPRPLLDTCIDAIRAADNNSDEYMKEGSYAYYVSFVAGEIWGGTDAPPLQDLEFEQLPEDIKTAYYSVEGVGTDQVELVGSLSDPIDPISLPRIQFFCIRTLPPIYFEMGLQIPDSYFDLFNLDEFGQVDLEKCLEYARAADRSEPAEDGTVATDEQLTRDEYANFNNLVTNNVFADVFVLQPAPLTDNFESLTSTLSDAILLPGLHSTEGGDPYALLSDAVNLPRFQWFCENTYAILSAEAPGQVGTGEVPPGDGGEGDAPIGTDQPGDSSGTDVPDGSEGMGTMPPVTEEFYSSCLRALILSDASRDNRLSNAEYVALLNRLTTNAFTGQSFDQLSPVFQTSYQDLSGEKGYIDVSGSKPYESPTEDQITALRDICAATSDSIFLHNTAPPPNGGDAGGNSTADGTQVPGDGTEGSDITEEFFQQCRTALVIGDSSRDGNLNSDEYVRFVNRLMANSFLGYSFDQLDPAFQSSYNQLSAGTGSIDVSGARPGPTPTDEVLAYLRNICVSTDQAIFQYNNPGEGGNDGIPDDGSGAQGDPNFLPECKSALTISDLSRDSMLSKAEYVRFFNRLTGASYAQFGDLDGAIQSNYDIISQGNSEGADISAANQVFVCSETQKAISGGGKSRVDFDTCQKALKESDLNNDSQLIPVEYVDVLNTLLDGAFDGKSFADIDEEFRLAYDSARGENSFVEVSGALSDTATETELANLRFVCEEIGSAIGIYNDVPVDEGLSDCIAVLDSQMASDSVNKGVMSEGEYLQLVGALAPELWDSAVSLDELPFVVGDNFEWIKFGRRVVDITGEDQQRRICARTITVLKLAMKVAEEAEATPGVILPYCSIPLKIADVNEDNSIDQTEFPSLIDQLSGNQWRGDAYDYLDQLLQSVFDSYADATTSAIPIASEEVYLTSLCGEIESAIEEVRYATAFFPLCKELLGKSDADGNDRLNQTEYVGFLYKVAGQETTTKTFDDLPQILQFNWNLIRFREDDVDVSGSGNEAPTAEQEANLQQVCAYVQEVMPTIEELVPLPPSSTGEELRVYNSFIISNTKGLTAESLQDGLNRAGLDVAYSDFVKDLVERSSSRLLLQIRNRLLSGVTLQEGSPDIYELRDSTCPDGVEAGATCQTAYASYKLIAGGSSADHNRIVNEYQILTQQAIDDGELQKSLTSVDSKNDLTIVKSSRPLRPPPDNEFDDSSDDEDETSSKNSFFTLPVIIGIAAGGAVVIFAFCLGMYFWWDRRRNRVIKPDMPGGDDKDVRTGDYDPEGGAAAAPNSYGDQGDGYYDDGYNQEQPLDEVNPLDEFAAARQSSKRQIYGDADDFGSAHQEENQYFGDQPEYDQQDPYAQPYDQQDQYAQPYNQQDPYAQPYGQQDQYAQQDGYVDEYAQQDGYADEYGQPYEQEEQYGQHGQYAEDERYVEPQGDVFGSVPVSEPFDGQQEGDGWGSTPNTWSNEQQFEGPGEVVETSQSSDASPDRNGNPAQDDFAERGATSSSNLSRGSNKRGNARSMNGSQNAPDGFAADAQEEEFEASVVSEESDESTLKFAGSESEEEKGEEEEEEESVSEESDDDEESASSESTEMADTIENSVLSSSQSALQTRIEIIQLVKRVVPDELDNVDAMIEQFAGREDELISTLQNMADMAAEGACVLFISLTLNLSD